MSSFLPNAGEYIPRTMQEQLRVFENRSTDFELNDEGDHIPRTLQEQNRSADLKLGHIPMIIPEQNSSTNLKLGDARTLQEQLRVFENQSSDFKLDDDVEEEKIHDDASDSGDKNKNDIQYQFIGKKEETKEIKQKRSQQLFGFVVMSSMTTIALVLVSWIFTSH